MKIVGISAFYHDSAAALVIDGNIIAAAQEERFSRKKFDPSFPIQSLRFCLQQADLKLSDIDEIVYYEKPFLSFERLLQSVIAKAPFSLFTFLCAMPIWMKEKLNTRATIEKKLRSSFPEEKIPRLTFSQHHLSHAASAFFPSPFESAAVLCLDGVGEWACTTSWVGKKNNLESRWEMHFPHSLGLLYSAFTSFCGFKVNSGEYKLMGLAPYGKPIYAEKIREHLIDVKNDGSFRLNTYYFPFTHSMKMTGKRFQELFGCAARPAEGEMQQIYKDLAASIQLVTEDVMLRLVRTLKKQTGEENLCLAGGVALNCVANGLIAKEEIFNKIWIQPAAGDAGGALGAALASYYIQHKNIRDLQSGADSMRSAYLGPCYSDEEIEKVLRRYDLCYQKFSEEQVIKSICDDLQNQKVVGWFQGAMEYGPRSLGSRSILGDPRSPSMQSHMNLKIKFRESFRPFAPVIVEEEVQNIYQDNWRSPYMLLVTHIRKGSEGAYPAITHVDGSSRIQTVNLSSNPLLYKILKRFNEETQCPLLINTSFNVRGEPIVCSPIDALKCFVQTDMDSLFIGSFYINKQMNNFDRAASHWRTNYELD